MAESQANLGLDEVRDRAWSVLARIERHGSEHFEIETNALGAVATTLAERHGHDTLPLGNGWWHLAEQAPDLLDQLAERLAGADAAERSRTGFDLALAWLIERIRFPDRRDFAAGARHLLEGRYAGDRRMPWVDANGLQATDDEQLRPVVARLRNTLEEHPELFGTHARFGVLFDHLPHDLDTHSLMRLLQPVGQALTASSVLMGGKPLGDIWRMEGVAIGNPMPGLIPFHAFLQELMLDLVGPLAESGRELRGLNTMPAPATRERCNQMLALHIIRPRHAAVSRLIHPPGSDIVIELRCLVTALIDRLADRVRSILDISVEQLPTVYLLHGIDTLAHERAGRSAGDQASATIAIAGAVF